MEEKVNLVAKLATFQEQWSPKIVARINDYDVMLVKVKGEFVWHKHDEADDFFLVVKGHLTIQLRDRNVDLSEGELFVVPPWYHVASSIALGPMRRSTSSSSSRSTPRIRETQGDR